MSIQTVLFSPTREHGEEHDGDSFCTPTQEHGVRRLGAALSANDSVAFTANCTVPLLSYLGCDDLCRGSCKISLLALLTAIYHIPGLLGCLQAALEARGAIKVLVGSRVSCLVGFGVSKSSRQCQRIQKCVPGQDRQAIKLCQLFTLVSACCR